MTTANRLPGEGLIPGRDGYVIVPRDPIDAQMEAGNAVFAAGEVPLNIYRAMVDVPTTRHALHHPELELTSAWNAWSEMAGKAPTELDRAHHNGGATAIMGLLISFGFLSLKQPAPDLEAVYYGNAIILFGAANDVEKSGFSVAGRHPSDRDTVAWWPGLGLAGLASRRFKRVLVTQSFWAEQHLSTWKTCEEAVQMLRTGQQVFGADAVWIELP